MIKRTRRRAYEHPNELFTRIETRRAEMVSEADAQAEALGLDANTHSDLLSAIVWQECAERAYSDADLTRMLFDWEMEAIQQDQSRDSLEQLIAIVREAGESYLADPDNYITAEMAPA